MFRKIQESDYPQVIAILQDVQEAGDALLFENMNDQQLINYWIKPNFQAMVYEEDGKILGSYTLGPIAEGRFSHIANSSYVVAKEARGKGVGKKMGLHSLEYAKEEGYKAIQFIRVVSTNHIAVETWKKVGFEILATVPKAFKHKELGFVDCYVLYKEL